MSGFAAFAAECAHRCSLGIERRPGNALNVEIGTPQPRCLIKPPDGRGITKEGGTLDYLRSGGNVLAYGVCSESSCPHEGAIANKVPA
jgi:hypothetical protein